MHGTVLVTKLDVNVSNVIMPHSHPKYIFSNKQDGHIIDIRYCGGDVAICNFFCVHVSRKNSLLDLIRMSKIVLSCFIIRSEGKWMKDPLNRASLATTQNMILFSFFYPERKSKNDDIREQGKEEKWTKIEARKKTVHTQPWWKQCLRSCWCMNPLLPKKISSYFFPAWIFSLFYFSPLSCK